MSDTSTRPVRRAAARLCTALTLILLTAGAWLQGETVAEDRGSDASEKSLMIILAISIGAVVTVAASAFIATKTALFK